MAKNALYFLEKAVKIAASLGSSCLLFLYIVTFFIIPRF